MKMMKAFIAGVFVFMNVFLFVVPVVSAAECDCYCASDNGAVPISEKDNRVFEDFQTCDYYCEYWGLGSALVCATDQSQLPQYNTYCFTRDMCTKQDGVWSEEQATDCLQNYRYCYPDPEKDEDVELAVSIGGMERPEDLSDYVQNVYDWLLGASLLVAIVMIMVAGAQWILSAGGASSAQKAQERIKAAVVGLVLLMSVSAILYIVNPQLLNLQMQDLPMVRTVYFLDDSIKCEKFVQAGYTVEPDRSALEESCGEDASKVVKDTAGMEIPEVDQIECQWSTCPIVDPIPNSSPSMKARGSCVAHPSNGELICLGCWDVTATNSLNIAPDETLCSTLTPDPIDKGDVFSCVHTLDGGFTQSNPFASVTGGQCALIAYKEDDIDSCSEYDTIKAVNNDGSEDLDSLREGRTGITDSLGEFVGSYLENWYIEFPQWKNLCESNGCVAEMSNSAYYISGSFFAANDCVEKEE
jgi:hypothetical protein